MKPATFPLEANQTPNGRRKKIKRNLQSELAAPSGWINMWEGWNKKTHERQRLSPGPVLLLRVNKRLHATWPFVFALENVPFTPHS